LHFVNDHSTINIFPTGDVIIDEISNGSNVTIQQSNNVTITNIVHWGSLLTVFSKNPIHITRMDDHDTRVHWCAPAPGVIIGTYVDGEKSKIQGCPY